MSNYTLPPLNYAYDALEPHIDAQTMEIHYTKHHQAYVNNLNAALKDTPHGSQPVEQLIADLNAALEAAHADTGVRAIVLTGAGGGPIDRILKDGHKAQAESRLLSLKRLFGAGSVWTARRVTTAWGESRSRLEYDATRGPT